MLISCQSLRYEKVPTLPRKEQKKSDDDEWSFRIYVKLQVAGKLLANSIITQTKFCNLIPTEVRGNLSYGKFDRCMSFIYYFLKLMQNGIKFVVFLEHHFVFPNKRISCK